MKTKSNNEQEEQKAFPILQLRENCEKVLNIESYVFDSVFIKPKPKYTIQEAKRLIQEWKRREVR